MDIGTWRLMSASSMLKGFASFGRLASGTRIGLPDTFRSAASPRPLLSSNTDQDYERTYQLSCSQQSSAARNETINRQLAHVHGAVLTYGESGMRILIVEDEVIIALDLQVTMESAGHTVIGPALTIAEAVELLQADRPDLALINMGDGNDSFHQFTLRGVDA